MLMECVCSQDIKVVAVGLQARNLDALILQRLQPGLSEQNA